MKSKNISVNIRKNEEVPYKEIYMIIKNSKQQVFLHQKFIDSEKNQKVILNFEECERLMNLFYYYVFKKKYEYAKDRVRIYRE
ncbi:MAG: hypothetical protein BAJALOKI2v1_340038 [Promethearchaeota archaeon]|nr:MAG: hypothetical protein BAJALOKI2v1_340038 [Candidatus Lokiarchaeota archaeon]